MRLYLTIIATLSIFAVAGGMRLIAKSDKHNDRELWFVGTMCVIVYSVLFIETVVMLY